MKTILIIDDSAYSRRLIRSALAKAGYRLLEAASGLEALEILQNEHVDLVTLDLLMPQTRGEVLLPQIKALSPETRVVVLTADSQEFTRQEMLSLHADAFLAKPVNPDALSDTVAHLLGE